VRHDPRAISGVRMKRYKSNELRPTNRGVREFIENSKFVHALLKLVAVFGVSLIMADGILTPAQSVLGAIQGIVCLYLYQACNMLTEYRPQRC
jgi:KUP system potassium uptake protein